MFFIHWNVEGGLELVHYICLCLPMVNLPQVEMHMTSLCTLQGQFCLWEERNRERIIFIQKISSELLSLTILAMYRLDIVPQLCFHVTASSLALDFTGVDDWENSAGLFLLMASLIGFMSSIDWPDVGSLYLINILYFSIPIISMFFTTDDYVPSNII